MKTRTKPDQVRYDIIMDRKTRDAASGRARAEGKSLAQVVREFIEKYATK